MAADARNNPRHNPTTSRRSLIFAKRWKHRHTRGPQYSLLPTTATDVSMPYFDTEITGTQDVRTREKFDACLCAPHLSVAMTEQQQRLPAILWESLQDICYRHDQKFITDVARILGVPALDLKKKVLGTRGVLTTVLVESGPWWTGLTCAIMERKECLWTRCSSICESGDTCLKHKDVRNGWNIRRFDDPYFACLPKRLPMNIEGVVYWVSEKGDVLNGYGVHVPGMRADIKTRSVWLSDDLGSKTEVQSES
jgi:hypothetical protein